MNTKTVLCSMLFVAASMVMATGCSTPGISKTEAKEAGWSYVIVVNKKKQPVIDFAYQELNGSISYTKAFRVHGWSGMESYTIRKVQPGTYYMRLPDFHRRTGPTYLDIARVFLGSITLEAGTIHYIGKITVNTTSRGNSYRGNSYYSISYEVERDKTENVKAVLKQKYPKFATDIENNFDITEIYGDGSGIN